MKPLHLLILSTLHAAREPLSRYEIMARVNQVAGLVEGPYSPGAVYHAISKLSDSRMINFNQSDGLVSTEGKQALEAALLSPPRAASLTAILYHAYCLRSYPDPTARNQGEKLLRLFMIDFNQKFTGDGQSNVAEISSFNNWRLSVGQAIERSVLMILAN